MTCSRCQTINPQGAVACAACGAPLVAMPMQQGYMPQGQPYMQPGQPYMVMAPVPTQRSGIPKVMGILMIIFASLGLLGTFASLSTDPAKENPFLADAPGYDNLKTMIMVLGILDLGIGGLHLFAGIRSVGYKRNGPGLAIAYAIARIIAVVIALVMVYAWLKPAMDVVPGAGAKVAGMFVGIGLVGSVWPILILALMTRPSAKASCVN